jgi:hypothetical protein
MRKIAIALVLTSALTLPAIAADKRIVFDTLKVFSASEASVYVSGTLTGDEIFNNSMSITCEKAGSILTDWPGKCVVARVEQIGDNHIGRIDAPEVYPIARWTPYEVIATDDPERLHRCRITIISINLKAQTVTWVEKPNPQENPIDCADAPTKSFRWTIEGWRW